MSVLHFGNQYVEEIGSAKLSRHSPSLGAQSINHKARKRFLSTFGKFLGGILLVSLGIFPFTDLKGIRGYAVVVMSASGVLAFIGALIVYGKGRGQLPDPELERHIDPRVVEEIRRDLQKGGGLGTELFYIGAACVGIGYLIFKLTE